MKTFLAYVVILTAIAVLVRLVSRDWKKVRQVTGFWAAYDACSWPYDYLLWGIVVGWLGDLWGNFICSVGALIINFFILRWYQKNGKDLMGVGILEEIKEKGHEWAEGWYGEPRWHKKFMVEARSHTSWYGKVIFYIPIKTLDFIAWCLKWPVYLIAKFFECIVWCLNKNDLLAFFALSLWKDSFVTTGFLRHGRFGKLEAGDYCVLLVSTIVSTVSWSVLMSVIVHAFKFALETL